MDNTELKTMLREHEKQKDIVRDTPLLLSKIKRSRDAWEMVGAISRKGNTVACAIIDSLSPELQLLVYWILHQQAGKENDLQSKLAAFVIAHAQKLRLPVVQDFNRFCEEIPALKAKALVS
jgi:hypothetical protein